MNDYQAQTQRKSGVSLIIMVLRSAALTVILLSTFLMFMNAQPTDLNISTALPPYQPVSMISQPMQYQISLGQNFKYDLSPSGQIDHLPQGCHTYPASIQITPTINISAQSQPTVSYSYSKATDKIYELHDDYLASTEVDWANNRTKASQRVQFSTQGKKTMLFDFKQSTLFVFTSSEVYQIDLQQPLALPQPVIRFNQSFSLLKAIRQQQLFILVHSSGLVIMAISIHMQIKVVSQIEGSHQMPLSPVDAVYQQGHLKVVDKQKGILFYQRKGRECTLSHRLSFPLNEVLTYTHIAISGNTLLLSAQTRLGAFVAQLQQSTGLNFTLMRYFKGYEQIDSITIWKGMLLLRSRWRMQVLPIGLDPRSIRQSMNGYALTQSLPIRSYHPIDPARDLFLLTLPTQLQIAHLSLLNGQLQCLIPSQGSYSFHFLTPCNNYPLQSHSLGSSCSLSTTLTVLVQSDSHDNYLWLTLIVVSCFIAGVMFLIYWRESKMTRIKYLLIKIKEMRERRKVQLESREERGEEEEVRSHNWSEIEEYSEHAEEVEGYEEYNAYQRYMAERND